ncbi:hypothetical protein NA56DRAFT_750546 [Hyaloscypha hepaticicola]|uniref:Uncharacterized protein n=1 Tax=Hyaloscypha hepaticicola TaxID=2082293 RepID=A0A2J6PZH5_9HELO|nr:hypothetical protein NA56DRAFT_750546 [Hyaloscypha hepaticicola]
MSSAASRVSTAVSCESLTTPSTLDSQPSDIRHSGMSGGGSFPGSSPSNLQEESYFHAESRDTAKLHDQETQDPTAESEGSQEPQGQKPNEVLPYNTFYNGFRISSALPYGLKPQKLAGRLQDRGTDKFPSLPMGLQQGQDLIDTIEHDETIQSSRASARSIHTNLSSQRRHRCRNPSPEPERIRHEMMRSSDERKKVYRMH